MQRALEMSPRRSSATAEDPRRRELQLPLRAVNAIRDDSCSILYMLSDTNT